MAVPLARRAPRRLRTAFVAVLFVVAIAAVPGMMLAKRGAGVALAAAGAGVRVTAEDVGLGPEFWRGTAEGDLVIKVWNTAIGAAEIQGTYTLPAGARLVTAEGADNCVDTGQLSFKCALNPTDPPGQIVVRVKVDVAAWRQAPLLGSAVAKVGNASDTDSFAVILPAGPPTAGIALSTTDLTLAPGAGSRPESGQLAVRLVNSGKAAAGGALEIASATGTEIRTFPPACTAHRRLPSGRDRCELGRIAPGKDVAIVFNMLIKPAARAEVPLTGAVFGYLKPPGKAPAAMMHSTYQILPNPADVTATASVSPSAAATSDPPRSQYAEAATDDQVTGRQLPTVVIVGSFIGLAAVAGVLVVVSLRRRMRDEVTPPADSDDPDERPRPQRPPFG